MNPLQEAIGNMVTEAARDPLPLLGPKGNLNRFSRRLDTDHLMLLYIEWSDAHKQNVYHASISRDAGKKNPTLEVALATLMAVEGYLGAPALYVYQDRLVHWYWLVEGRGAESTPGAVQ